QASYQPAADEAGGAGDEDGPAHSAAPPGLRQLVAQIAANAPAVRATVVGVLLSHEDERPGAHLNTRAGAQQAAGDCRAVDLRGQQAAALDQDELVLSGVRDDRMLEVDAVEP